MMAKQKSTFTAEKLKASACAILNKALIDELEGKPKQKKSKYNNKKTEVNGEMLDSVREAERYKYLLKLQKLGIIGQLRRQVPYELNKDGKFSYRYFADFVYIVTETGETIVEDAKGAITAVYRKKRRLMKKIYGIEIKEV